MKTISQKQAKQQNLKYYFTGKSCKRGHITQRRTTNGTCIECESVLRDNRIDQRKTANKKYRENNKAKIAQKAKQYYIDNLKQIKLSGKVWRENNQETIRENGKRYYHNNPGKQHARNAKRRATQLQATPQWFEKNTISNLYEKAKMLTTNTGVSHHVDHIIPLQGNNVCGLHCLDNLQILTAVDNIRKSNKF